MMMMMMMVVVVMMMVVITVHVLATQQPNGKLKNQH
jgi:hypothetical protein